MFTVCPKCALTLVVTAADLRVAQGYVRCGRCSNVFNALARLSEDRAAGTNATPQVPAPAAAPKPTPSPQKAEPTGTFRSRAAPDTSATSKARSMEPTSAKAGPVSDPATSAKMRQAPVPPPPAADVRTSPTPPPEPKRYDDDSIAEEDLEFNADATDLNKVFVEQSPSPQFTAATGTFKSLKLEAESAARSTEELARTDEHEPPAHDNFEPVDTQVDVEIDPDLLATMAQLTSNRLERLSPPPEPEPTRVEPPKPTAAAKSTLVLQPPVEQPPQPAPPMRLAERAKARAEAARTGDTARFQDVPVKPATAKPESRPDPKPRQDSQSSALETTQAIRDALAPRKRSPPLGEEAAAEQPTSLFAAMWTAGSAVLFLILLAQIVHHYRNELAATATFNGPLTSIYAVLGIPLVPRWDLTAYEVRQLGASTADAPGQIVVRASVKNSAHQAQPLPMLRVTLQDRFGNRIASRDVPPQSYLPRAIPGSSLLSGGQRIDAEMAFVDPGANAVGFEIDACLPAPGGGISCANDAAR